MMSKYIALIGDIRDSRKLENRAQVQETLGAICRELNATDGAAMTASPFTLTLGDEFQALFRWPERLWRGVFTFEAMMHPVRLRYGLGIGEITTAINTQSAIGMDGPAFYLARDAVEDIRKAGKTFRIHGLGDTAGLVNGALDLISLEREAWKGNRVKVFANFLAREPVSSIANKLAISEQAVYKNIKDGKMETIASLLESITKEMVSALQG